MSILVKTFNGDELKDAISKSPKIVIEYIEALRRIYSNERKLTVDCMKKLRGNPLTVERVLDAIEKKYGELAVLHIYPSGINTVWCNGKLLKSIDGNIKRWVQQVESEGK